MKPIKLSEDLRPLSDLKASPGDIVRQIEETGRPVIITRHGRGVAVMMSLSEFEEYQSMVTRREMQRELDAAVADVEAGRTKAHDDVRARLESRLGVKLAHQD